MPIRNANHHVPRRFAMTLIVIGSVAWMVYAAARATAPTTHPSHHDVSHMENLPAGAASQASGRPATTLKRVSCERLPDVPGKIVTTAIVAFPPHAYSAAHRHPGSVQAFVLRGTLRSQVMGSAAATYRAGESWFEPGGVLHLFAENPTAEPAELLAVFITGENCGPLVIPEP